MATIIGSSGTNSSGGYIQVRLTYSVSNNVVTFTQLEARKQPSNLTTATTGTWGMTVRCGYNNVLVNEFPYASVYGNTWTTLWSGSVSSSITSDTTIYGVVAAPSGTSYAGLTATASTTISYQQSGHNVTIYHWYNGARINIDFIQDVEDYSLFPIEEYVMTSTEYAFSYAMVDGSKVTGYIRITKDTTIDMYYEKLKKWTVYDQSGLSGDLGGIYNFAQYQIHRWYYYVPEDMQIEFKTSGSADTIGWISNSEQWSVDDNGRPQSGYYIQMNDNYSGSNFSLTYNAKQGELIYFYVSIYQGQAASNVNVSISFIKDKYKVTMIYRVEDKSYSGGFRLETSEQHTFNRGSSISPKDYISPSGLDSSYALLYVEIRGIETLASNISTLLYTIDRDEDWNFYYRRSYWSWSSANRSTSDAASAEQTIKAHEAITGNGKTNDFHYKVWNDLCAVTKDVLENKSYTWNTTYASYDNTLMSDSSKTLTAVRFNSLRINIDKLCSTGISTKTKYNGTVSDSNKVIGNEFIILTNCLNSA